MSPTHTRSSSSEAGAKTRRTRSLAGGGAEGSVIVVRFHRRLARPVSPRMAIRRATRCRPQTMPFRRN